MSNHFSADNLKFPGDDRRLDLTDVFVFQAPASYPNGRVTTDDVYSIRFAWLTNGKVPPSGLKPHDDLLAEFPYLGPPNP